MSQAKPTLPTHFEDNVHQALSLWHKDASAGSPLAELALIRRAQAEGQVNLRRATNQVLLQALERLEADHALDASLLRQRFLDDRPAYAVANDLNLAEPTLFKKQRAAIHRLAEILYHLELAARGGPVTAFERHAPPPSYHQLVGFDLHVTSLGEVLTNPRQSHIVSIEGLGGLGKTALAHRLSQHVTMEQNAFDDFGWVSAQQQVFHLSGSIQPVDSPALTSADLIEALAGQLLSRGALPIPFSVEQALTLLQSKLRQSPALLVVDNLETLADVEALLPTLRRLAGPSKFLLTSRKALLGEPDIYHFPVPELAEPEALRLLRSEAELRNLPVVLAAGDDDLRPIYATVGGNPLALRLVAGQLYLLSLDQVLDNLRAVRGRPVDEMYRFIYWQAWRQLDDACQEVMLAMPLFAHDGADFASIERVSEVKGGRLLDVLERLVRLSLVNVTGDLLVRRYAIHRLTETFLRTDVIGW